ncbi:MAG TPA: PhaM family polyhydroxyalkanoate granule multifunctional regulatory protein [Burkholderiales bacterium]|nr:PhaM family polyhydroxyalkanoate granule multifunctional regulatory protein [Burkholderiales bacterium]
MTQDTQSNDPFEFLKRMWAPMGLPMPGVMAPLLDPNEIEKRIADLKSVENWLAMNLNVLRMTIQGLEMQRATLAAFQAMHAPAAAGAQAPTPEAAARPSTAAGTPDAWWNLLQQTQAAATPAPQSEPKREKKPK